MDRRHGLSSEELSPNPEHARALRTPSPARVPTAKRTPPLQRRSAGTDGPASGSSSEEPSPSPHHPRTRDSPRRTQPARLAPPMSPPVEIPSPSRKEKSPSRKHLAQCPSASPSRHARDHRHRTECAAGADLLTADTAVSGCALVQLAGPTTGPPAPHRSQLTRSSNVCVRVVSSRVTHEPFRLAVERSEDHRRTRSSDPASCHLRTTPFDGGSAPMTDPPRSSATQVALPRLVSSRSPVVSARRRAVRRPPSDEQVRPASCHLRTTPFDGGSRPATGSARSSATQVALPRLVSSRSPVVSARRRAVRRPPSDEQVRPASCHLRTTPSDGGSRPATGPARSSATPAPRASSRVGSSAGLHPSPSSGPKTTIRRRTPACEAPPSSRLLGRRSGGGSGPIFRDTDTAHVVSCRIVRRPPPLAVQRPEDHHLAKSFDLRVPPSNRLSSGAPATKSGPIFRDTDTAHVVSRRTTRRSSPIAVQWPEDHCPTTSSNPRAVTFEPPFERRSGDGSGSIFRDTDTAHVVSRRIVRRSSHLTVQWPEDHHLSRSSDLRAATFEPPVGRRSGDQSGPIFRDAAVLLGEHAARAATAADVSAGHDRAKRAIRTWLECTTTSRADRLPRGPRAPSFGDRVPKRMVGSAAPSSESCPRRRRLESP
jgi:hypothetical protein